MNKVKSLALGLSGLIWFGSNVADALPTAELLHQLNDESFAKREGAHQQLMELLLAGGKKDLVAMKDFFKKTDLPEVKSRLGDLLDAVDFTPIPNTRGFVGITMLPGNKGVIVGAVHRGTAAEKARLKPGDEVVELDGKDLTQLRAQNKSSSQYFSDYVKGKKAGEKLKLKVMRGGKDIDITLKLGSYDQFMKEQGAQLGVLPMQFRNKRMLLQRAGGRLQIQPLQGGGIPPEELARIQKEMIEQLQKEFAKQNLKLGAKGLKKIPSKKTPIAPLKKKPSKK